MNCAVSRPSRPRSWAGVVTWPPIGQAPAQRRAGGIPWPWDQHMAAPDQPTGPIGTMNCAVSRPSRPRSLVWVVTWPPMWQAPVQGRAGGIPWPWDQHMAAADQATEPIGTENNAVSRPSCWCFRCWSRDPPTHQLENPCNYVCFAALTLIWLLFSTTLTSRKHWNGSSSIFLIFLKIGLVTLLSQNWNNSVQWKKNSLWAVQQVPWACAWSKWQGSI